MAQFLRAFNILSLLVVLAAGNAVGQFSLFGGASLPVGAFGGTTITNTDDGFAKLGFNLGLQNDINIANSLNWTTSGIVSINSFNSSEMEYQANQFAGGGVKVEGGSYYTYLLLTGLGLKTTISNSVNMFFQGQVGVLFSKMPDITISYSSMSAAQTAKLATAFAYGFAGGIDFSNVILSVRYCYGEPEYEEVASSGGQSYTVKVSLPASMIYFNVGLVL